MCNSGNYHGTRGQLVHTSHTYAVQPEPTRFNKSREYVTAEGYRQAARLVSTPAPGPYQGANKAFGATTLNGRRVRGSVPSAPRRHVEAGYTDNAPGKKISGRCRLLRNKILERSENVLSQNVLSQNVLSRQGIYGGTSSENVLRTCKISERRRLRRSELQKRSESILRGACD